MRGTVEIQNTRMKSKPDDGKISHKHIEHLQKLFSAFCHWTVYITHTSVFLTFSLQIKV